MGALLEVALGAGVAGVGVLEAEQAGGALDDAGDVVVGQGDEVALLVHDFDADLDDVVGGGEGGLVGRGAQGVGAPAGADVRGGSVGGFAAEGAGGVVDVPVEDVGGGVARGLAAYGLVVGGGGGVGVLGAEQQAGGGGVGVADDAHALAGVVVPEGCGVGGDPLAALAPAVAPAVGARGGVGADVAYGCLAPECCPVVSYGLDVACEVEQSCLGASCGPGSALAEVVDAGPEELAEDVGVVAHGFPGGEVVAVLAAVDDAAGVALVVFGVAALGVVVADDVHGFGVGCLVAHDDSCQGSGDGARGVDVAHDLGESLGDDAYALGIGLLRLIAAIHGLGDAATVEHGMRVGVVGIVNLVADAPHDH